MQWQGALSKKLSKEVSMYNYPLNFRFAVFDIGDRVTITDGEDEPVAFVQQKAFRLKEDVSVYEDDSRQGLLYRIQADQMLDISATYRITDAQHKTVGSVIRHGMRSFWRASYEIKDAAGSALGTTTERNPWVKMIDGLLEAIPFVGPVLAMIASYFLNPTYDLQLSGGRKATIVKHRSLLEGRFALESDNKLSEEEETLLLPAVVIMIVLERSRG